MTGDIQYSRLFVATPVPEQIAGLMQQLISQNSLHASLKWMRPYNLHLTIYFIGNVNLSDKKDITERIHEIARLHPSFQLKPVEVCLRPIEKPRMVWVRYEQHGVFTSLNKALHKALSPMVQHPAEQYDVPTPHITLARFKGFDNWQDLNLVHRFELPSISISEIAVWQTEEKNGQRDYVSWAEVLRLGG